MRDWLVMRGTATTTQLRNRLRLCLDAGRCGCDCTAASIVELGHILLNSAYFPDLGYVSARKPFVGTKMSFVRDGQAGAIIYRTCFWISKPFDFQIQGNKGKTCTDTSLPGQRLSVSSDTCGLVEFVVGRAVFESFPRDWISLCI